MNYASLRAFHAVASHGSFTRAAQSLGVTQPTLSAQVKALEETYGIALLDRRGRGIAATSLGEQLLDITRRLFLLEEEADELLSRARDLTAGHLRVAAGGPYYAVPLLAAFGARYPGVHISLSIGNSEEVLDALLHYRADVAVISDLEPDPRLEAIPYAEHRLVVFVPRKHPWARARGIRLRDLEGQPMVLREIGSMTRRLFEQATAKAKIKPRVVMEIESREAVSEAVAAGLGIGVVSEAEFGHDQRLAAVPVIDATMLTREYVVCLKERRRLRIVSAFLDQAYRRLRPPIPGAARN
ncbi:MAG TPA: LysR substrate-binding domain-containing protein [Stellaceae bacterium]|nr:LysR substrate-binding domain-containing protein [Stellaceae bacterium]